MGDHAGILGAVVFLHRSFFLADPLEFCSIDLYFSCDPSSTTIDIPGVKVNRRIPNSTMVLRQLFFGSFQNTVQSYHDERGPRAPLADTHDE